MRRAPARRGSHAVEFALTIPVLLTLFSGMIDVSEVLMAHDALVAAVSEASRGGSIVDPHLGGSPTATASATASQAWSATERAETPTFTVALSGAAPDTSLVVTGTVTITPLVGLVPLNSTLSYTSTTRLTYQ